MAAKCSLFNRVTISNAELVIRSARNELRKHRGRKKKFRRASQDFGSGRKNTEHCPPARTHVLDASLDHLLEALQNLNRSQMRQSVNVTIKAYHISDLRVRIVRHRVLERSQEIFLELEVWQLLLFEEPHSELSQGIEGKESDMRVTMATDLRETVGKREAERSKRRPHLIEMLPENVPQIRPL
jgi:hypothetical protein